MVVQTVENLTHRFSAHPDEQVLSRAEFIAEIVGMLAAYLSCSRLNAEKTGTESSA